MSGDNSERPPPLNCFGSDAASSADNPELVGFRDFLRSGDAPTPMGSPPPQGSPEAQPSVELSVDALRVTGNVVDGEPTIPPPAHHPAPASAPPPTTAAAGEAGAGEESSFLGGLFRRAASTIESTVEAARREVAVNEVLQGAQETLSAAFAPAVTEPSETTLSAPPRVQMRGPHPEKTTSSRALRVSSSMGAEPLSMFVGGASRDLFVVTEHTIEAFGRDGAKILQANLGELRANAASAANGDDATLSPGQRRARLHSRPLDGAVRATCCAHYAEKHELAVAHADSTIQVYSVRSGQMGELLRSGDNLAATATCLEAAHAESANDVPRLLIGGANGLLTLAKADDLTDVAWLHAPEACETPLGAGCTAPPLSCIAFVPRKVSSTVLPATSSVDVIVGYDDGFVQAGTFNDPSSTVCYAAHGGRVNGVVSFFDGALAVTIGCEEDRSLAACVAETGRCLLRRMLPYVPTSINRVDPGWVDGERNERWVCASEHAFLVGGCDGEIDLFRVVPLSPAKVEFRLVRRVSERIRGRKRAVLQTLYVEEEATLHALCRAGEVRRWALSAEDAAALVTPERRLRASVYDAARATKVVAMAGDEDGVSTRLAVGEGVIAAQRVLAMAQDDDAGLDEDGKDRLVEAFQKEQSDMQELAEQADAELRRGKLRIARQFARAAEKLPDGAPLWMVRLVNAAQRAAAAELNTVVHKHSDTLASIRGDTVDKLRAVILKAVEAARGDTEKVTAVREAAKKLADIPTDSL